MVEILNFIEPLLFQIYFNRYLKNGNFEIFFAVIILNLF